MFSESSFSNVAEYNIICQYKLGTNGYDINDASNNCGLNMIICICTKSFLVA
jgi:hypothetical protein